MQTERRPKSLLRIRVCRDGSFAHGKSQFPIRKSNTGLAFKSLLTSFWPIFTDPMPRTRHSFSETPQRPPHRSDKPERPGAASVASRQHCLQETTSPPHPRSGHAVLARKQSLQPGPVEVTAERILRHCAFANSSVRFCRHRKSLPAVTPGRTAESA